MKRLDSQGHTLVEMCIAIVIFALTAQAMAVALLVIARQIISNEDHGYAAIKGQQLFNELMAQANRNPGYGGAVLDGFNDGAQYKQVLTIDPQVQQPNDPVSGNRQTNGHWRYLRQIRVGPTAGGFQAREVLVNIWRYSSDNSPLVPGLLLTTVEGTINPGGPITYKQIPPVYPRPIN